MDYFEFDLNNTDEVPGLLEQIFSRIEKNYAEEICLINNAGVLSPVKAVQEIDVEDIKSNITINLITPLALITQFLRLTKDMKIVKKVVNISS